MMLIAFCSQEKPEDYVIWNYLASVPQLLPGVYPELIYASPDELLPMLTSKSRILGYIVFLAVDRRVRRNELHINLCAALSHVHVVYVTAGRDQTVETPVLPAAAISRRSGRDELYNLVGNLLAIYVKERYREQSLLTFASGERLFNLPVDAIELMEAYENRTVIYTADGRYILDEPLDTLRNRLPGGFNRYRARNAQMGAE